MTTCQTCRYWVDRQCHRYPPALVHPDRAQGLAYPRTGERDWCGEHAPKP